MMNERKTQEKKEERNPLQPHSLIGFKDSGVAVGSFGGELAALPQLGWSSVRTSVTNVDLLLHSLHTLQTWTQVQCNPANTRHQLILAGTLLEELNSERTPYPHSFGQVSVSNRFILKCVSALLLPTCEMALKALVLPSFSPPLETDSAEWMAVLAASSTPSLIFLPISVRLTSSRPCGHVYKINTLSTVGHKDCR